jgi:prepilin-type N-terminal cleavage/methylation domain-containing protein
MSTPMLARLRRSQGGFTLIELLIAMPLALVVLGGLTFTIVRTSHWGGQLQEESAQQTEARAVVSTIVSDLRQAYYRSGQAPIASGFSSTAMTFYSPDRQTPFHLRKISYQLASRKFQRSALVSSQTFVDPPTWTFTGTAGWQTLLPLVTNSDVFTYYDANSDVYTGTDPLMIRRVDVKLTTSTGGEQPRITTYTATAVLRGTSQ